MNLPKPRQIPISYSFNSDNKDSVAVVTATTYTANAMFEQFQLSSKILSSLSMLNTNFSKMLNLLVMQQQKRNENSEENDLEKRPSRQNPAFKTSMDNDVSFFVGRIKDIIVGATALLGGALVTMLDDAKRSVYKEISSFTLALTAFSTDLASSTKTLLETTKTKIGGIFSATSEYAKSLSRWLYISFESSLAMIKTYDLERFSKPVMEFLEGIGKKMNFLGLTMKEINTLLEPFEKGVRYIYDMTAKALKPIQKLVSFITEVSVSFVKGIAKITESGVMKTLLAFAPVAEKIIKKILWPIQLVLSISDFINGFMEGYAKEGWLEGVKQGLIKVFDGFFGGIVGLVDSVVTTILETFGLKETADTFSKGIKENWENIKNVVSGVLDIFKGILSLDPKLIWSGLSTGFLSLKDLVYGSIKNSLLVAASLFDDLAGTDISKRLEGLFDWFQNDAYDQMKGLLQSFLTSMADTVRWLLENTIPYGTELANKIFGQRAATTDEIETEARKVAQERIRKEFEEKNGSWSLANIMATASDYGLSERPKALDQVTILAADRVEAQKRLVDNGYLIENQVKSTNPTTGTMADNIRNLDKPKTQSGSTNISQINNVNNGSTASAPVVINSGPNKAYSASPLNRYK